LKIKKKGEKYDTFTEYRLASITALYYSQQKNLVKSHDDYPVNYFTLANCTLDFDVITPCCISTTKG